MDKTSKNAEMEIQSTNSSENKEKPKTTMNARKIKMLISIIYGNLFLGSCYSLMAPIFPAEAERKNASPSSYGLVFGIYQLSMCIASLLYGKLIPILKPGYMMKTGMLVSAICVILFGLLDNAPAGPAFIWLAGSIRLVDALGAAAYFTASYTVLGVEMSEIIGRAMSIAETAFALGLAGGPVLGGILYDVGGFRLPFLFLGVLLLIGTGINCFLFTDKDADIPSQESLSIRKLLSDVDFLIDALAVHSCFALLGFNELSLEPHIRQFDLSSTITGVIFLIGGLTDAIFSIFWGYFAEKVSNAQYLTFVGCILFILCFLIVGPASFFHYPAQLWLVLLSQFLLGLAMAAKIVCSFTHALKHMVEKGFPNDVGTYSLVSGMLFSTACLGAFIGPAVGGILIDEIGYIRTTEVIVGIEILVAFACASRLIILFMRKNVDVKGDLQD